VVKKYFVSKRKILETYPGKLPIGIATTVCRSAYVSGSKSNAFDGPESCLLTESPTRIACRDDHDAPEEVFQSFLSGEGNCDTA